MRNLLIVVGLGILIAAWAATSAAGGRGHGSAHGASGHGGHEGRMRHGAGHTDLVGMLLATEIWHEELGPGPVAPEMFASGLMSGEADHAVAGHSGGTGIHPHSHIPLHPERGSAMIPQPTAGDGSASDQDGAASAQPNPPVNPWSPIPPGAAGPGQPVSGRAGPGRPGPGQPARPRW
jgi:hypothetical protein